MPVFQTSYTPTGAAGAQQFQNVSDEELARAQAEYDRQIAERNKDNKPWWQRGLETAADIGTFGTYSAAKEGLGYGESSSYIDTLNDKYNPLYGDVKDAVGVAGETLGVDAETLGFADGSGGGPLKPYDMGQAAYDEWGDRAAFTYGEALDASERQYTPGNIRDVAPIVAPEIRDVNLAPVERVTASGPAAVTGYDASRVADTTVGPAATGVFSGVDRARLDMDPQAEIRQRQLQGLDMLTAGAQGQGPSAGRATYDAALGRLVDEQMGVVNQASGEDKAAARLEAIQQIGRQGTIAARDAAALDAQTQQSYIQQLSGALNQTRGQDIDLSAKAADLAQQANSLDAQLRQATEMGNVQEINRLTALRANITAQQNETNAQLQQQSRQFGAQAANTSALDYGQRLDDAAATNAAAANKRESDQAGLRLQRDTSAGAQSIDAQTTTNEQGVQRDVAADTAGRGAFTATTDAKLGALNTANSATSAGTNVAGGQVQATKYGYDAAVAEREAAAKKKAATNEARRQLLTGLIT